MKRFIALLCCLTVALSAGCSQSAVEKEPVGEGYELYFRETNLAAAAGGDALRAECVTLTGVSQDNAEEVATALMKSLLEGPEDPALRSPFPAGTVLLSLEVENGQADVDLSAAYQSLSGVALTLADYAITLTLTQLPEISVVRITVRGKELAYRDSQAFTARDVLFSTTEDVVGTVAATLYFLDGKGELLPRDMVLDLYEGDTQVMAVVAALELGPEEKELSSALTEEFRVISAWLEEKVCYVNLSSAAVQNGTDQKTMLRAVKALVQSLLSLESVEEVRFMVDGEFAQYYGKVPVSESYHA